MDEIVCLFCPNKCNGNCEDEERDCSCAYACTCGSNPCGGQVTLTNCECCDLPAGQCENMLPSETMVLTLVLEAA